MIDGLHFAQSSTVAGPLADIFVVLLAAKIGDELFRRLRQPVVIGEILAGVIIGPSVLGIVTFTEVLQVMSELGVVFILFWVGLQMRVSELKRVGQAAFSVAVLGVLVPVAAGFGLGLALGEPTATSLFLAAALAATSAGITAAVLTELKLLDSRAGRTILGAAVIDDVLALVLLAVAVGLAGSGVQALDILQIIGLALIFVGLFALGGTRLLRGRPGLLEVPRFAESPLLPAVLLCLGLAVIAAEIGLAAIIGAFLAGVMVAETKDQNAIESEIAPLYSFFAPFFFVAIGLQVATSAVDDLESIALVIGVTALAIVTKHSGAWLGARSLGSKAAHFVGVGMVPRGEVGIIVASIGHVEGVVDDQLFAVIVAMSLLTTVFAPPLLRRLGQGLEPAS